MELGYLLNNNTTGKAYKHFSINATPSSISTSQSRDITTPNQKPEFFFVGKNTKKIDILIQLFEGGYAAESVKSAINILKRLPAINGQFYSSIAVIIIDASCGESEINELNSYITKNKNFCDIPLVLEASDLSKETLTNYRKLKIVDELIFLGKNNDKLLAKVEFLQKLKAKSNEDIFRKNINTSVNEISPKFSAGYVLKRVFDILISSLIIILVSPILLLIAIAIKIESKGPIFYISKRAGRGYKVFDFYKFRTMVVDADQKINELSHLNQYSEYTEGPVFFKMSNDPRVTKIGTMLRNSSLDELPQLFNVFIGNMSLVGNRPLPLYEAATLTTDEYAVRFMAPAGITGLWQVKKRGDKHMSVKERVSLDIDYAEKNSFAYDLWILANTPSALMQKDNV